MSLIPKAPYCRECNDYLARRGDVLVSHVVATAARRKVDAKRLFVGYVDAVHDRHESGLSLEVAR